MKPMNSLIFRVRIAAVLVVSVSAALSAPAVRGQDGKQTSRDAAAPPRSTSPADGTSPLDEPLRLATQAQEKFRTIQDYTCTFIKRERIGGQLLPEEYVFLKSRTRPFSIYMKWQQPYEGREVIYVKGQNDGKLLAHSTGVEKVVGGTVALDPRGEMAMENSRHDITEAGLGNLVDQLVLRWSGERKLGQTKAEVKENATVDGRSCWCVKTQHPADPKHYAYYRSRVFFDKQHGLPIRFEGYDWPRRGSAPDGDAVEVYTYRDLRLNVSLTALDFSVENPKYSFGRF